MHDASSPRAWERVSSRHADDMLLFRPPAGVEAPERMVRMFFHHRNPQFGEWRNSSVSYPDFLDLTRAKSFSAIAAQYVTGASLGRGADAAQITAEDWPV